MSPGLPADEHDERPACRDLFQDHAAAIEAIGRLVKQLEVMETAATEYKDDVTDAYYTMWDKRKEKDKEADKVSLYNTITNSNARSPVR